MHLAHWALLLACMLAGSLTFRIRGGLSEGWAFTLSGKLRSAQLPGQLARLTWALACGVAVLLATRGKTRRDREAAATVVPLAFAATTLPLGGTIDMGHNDGTFLRDFIVGTLHGLSMGAFIAAVLAGFHFYLAPDLFALWYVPLVSGAAWGACYALAWLRTDWSVLTRLRLGKYGNPPEMAELIFGAQFGAALFLAAVP